MVTTGKVARVLEVLKRFIDPSNLVKTSGLLVFDRGNILVTSGWGGCLYHGPDSLLTPDEVMGMDVSVVQDLLPILSLRKQEEELSITLSNDVCYITVGRRVLNYGSKRLEGALIRSEHILQEVKRNKIADSFLSVLRDLSFGISDNAFDSQFGGIWYSETDKIIYASDGARITWMPLGSELGTNENFFVPAVFLKKVPGLKLELKSIAVEGGLCYFFFKDFVPFFLLRDTKMPAFGSAVDQLKNGALSSGNWFTLDLSKDKRDELKAARSLYYDARGEVSDVLLSREGSDLVVKVIHKQDQVARGSTDYITILAGEGNDDLQFRMNAEYFLDALDHFDTFFYNPHQCIYSENTETGMEQIIGWKG